MFENFYHGLINASKGSDLIEIVRPVDACSTKPEISESWN